MNSFMDALTEANNFTRTANGALAHKSTRSMVYDMFALGGAYRNRSNEDCVLLFKNAYEENPELALKCLFYLRDCRGGQGERRFFRLCFNWLCRNDKDAAFRNLNNLSEYGRWDDLWYTTVGTPLFENALFRVKRQLILDVDCKTPSLLAKWLPSENASSKETKQMANQIREYLGMTHKQYRKTLSTLRTRINVLEKLMSANRWEEIEFDKIPSKAGLIYKNAFARRDIIAKRYESFIKSEKTTVNAKTLYPYEIVAKAAEAGDWGYRFNSLSDIDREALQKYWNNLPDYFNGAACKLMCVVDTSGSMTCGRGSTKPLHTAIALGMYAAERLNGPFKNHYISFSSSPRLVRIEGIDFVDKVRRIYRDDLCSNTDIEATFDMLMQVAKKADPADVPETLVIISDMQIDQGTRYYWRQDQVATEMERIRRRWEMNGLKMPKLVYWNVNASKNTILDDGPNVSYVSGNSPVIFEQVLTGVTGYDLMLKKLMSERYAAVK